MQLFIEFSGLTDRLNNKQMAVLLMKALLQRLSVRTGAICYRQLSASVVMEEEIDVMSNNEWPIILTAQSKDQCRKQLRQVIDAAVNELLQDGWEPRCIVEALVKLADDYMDTVICGTALNAHTTQYH